MVGTALGVDDDSLEALGAHDGTHATAAGVAHGAHFAVGKGDGGGGELEFTGAADGHVAAPLAVLFNELFHGGKVVQTGHSGGHEAGGVLAHFELPPFAFGSHIFNDDSHDAKLGEMAAGLAAGVGFLDAFGEGALAAHGDTVAVGAVGSTEQTGGEDQLVVRAEGGAEGVDFAGHNGGGQATAAEAGVFSGDLFEHAGLGGHVDSEETEHSYSLDKSLGNGKKETLAHILQYHRQRVRFASSFPKNTHAFFP